MKVVLDSLDINPVIYGIRCKINNKIYIGKAKNYFSRLALHLSDLKLQKHHSKLLQYDYNKFGKQEFEFLIIRECDSNENLLLIELEEISKINPDLLYNTNNIVNNIVCYDSKTGEILGSYFNVTDAAIKTNISPSIIYQSCYEEHQRLNDYGISFIFEKNKNKIPERLKNIGQGNCFKKGNPYRFKKDNPYKFKKDNPYRFKTKRIISFDKQGNQIETYESIKEAASLLKLHATNISNCLRGKAKSAGGYIFKYA